MFNLFKKNNNKVKIAKKNSLFSKKYVIPFVLVFALIGGYFVFRLFAYESNLQGNDGEFIALSPTRILNTRDGNGGYTQPLGPKQEYTVDIAGRGGVPLTNVRSVVMNVVAVRPTAQTYITIYPSGEERPVASSINAAPGQVIANEITVKLGADGKVKVYNNSGDVHVLFDVAGYFVDEDGGPGARFQSVSPTRIFDTRNGNGGYTRPIGAKQEYTVDIAGRGGLPTTGISSVVLNVVAARPTAQTYVTIYPSGEERPVASSINAAPGQVVANQITAKVGADGKVKVYNNSGDTHVLFDVAGYYEEEFVGEERSQEGRFVPTSPTRILNTRDGNGGYTQPIGAKQEYTVDIAGRGGLPTTGISSVVLNVVAVRPTEQTYVTIYPSGEGRPVASSINAAPGQVVANQITAKVGTDGKVKVYNNSGDTHVLFDVAGYYTDYSNNYGSSASYSLAPDGEYANSIRKIEQTVDIRSLPSSRGTRAIIDVIANRYGESSNWVRMNLDDAKYTIACHPNDQYQCVALASNAVTGETSSGFFNIDIPEQFTTGDYKFIYQVVENEPNLPGRWLKTSVVTPNGTTKALYAEKRTELLNSFGPNAGLSQGKINCRRPRYIEVAVGEILYDGAPRNVSLDRASDWRGGVCRGAQQTVINPGSTAQADLYTMRTGIRRAQRDTIPPSATLSWDAATSMWKLTAEDNVSVAGYSSKNANAYIQLHGASVTQEGYFHAGWYGLQEGDNVITYVVQDTSGNETILEQVISGVATPPWLQQVE